MSHRGKRSQTGNQNRQKRALSHEEQIIEKDAARAVIKSQCYRDNVSGDIVYTGKQKEKEAITAALLTTQFCVVHEVVVSKHVKPQIEKQWPHISPEAADAVLSKLDVGEVLNRPGEACWWR